VLPAADLFLGQALHLFKHLSRDQMRTSQMLELYRHLLARGDDPVFWSLVRELCAGEPRKLPGLAVALEFVAQQMDPACVPTSVRSWTTASLPLAARLWARRYGGRVATASFPGTKLHLLLQEALAPGEESVSAAVRSRLLPRQLPSPIAVPPVDETLLQAMSRQVRQASFILFRARFHVGEGLGYLRERRRWQALLRCVPAPTMQGMHRGLSPSSCRPAPTATKP
jgi:hypothetical protein